MQTQWWHTLYDNETVANLFLDHQDRKLVDQCDFLIKILELETDALVFDQCCGTGTQSIALAERGMKVIGVDSSSRYIKAAQKRAHELPHVTFNQGDAFEFETEQACDAAFNWGTSIGNVTDDDHNRQMPARAFTSLKSGACYAVEYPNVPALLTNFKPCMSRRPVTGEAVVFRESRIDCERGTLHQIWTILSADKSVETVETTVKLYLPHQLGDMLSSVGFTDLRYYGDTAANPLTVESARVICVGRKP